MTATISQIYLDSKENLWALNQGNTPLVKWNKESGWTAVANYNLVGNPRIIGEYSGILYLYLVNGINRDIYSYSNNVFKKVESIPYVSSLGNFEIDKVGRIWFWQSDKLLRINPCSYLNAPTLQASKKQIVAGESIELKADGCTNVAWTWNVENQNQQNQIVLDKNTLTVKPESTTLYKAQCIDSECVSEFSNLIEADVSSLAVASLDKKNYCANDQISYNLLMKGKFDTKNEIVAYFSNKNSNYTSPVILDGGQYKSLIPKNMANGKYWVKLKTTSPVITSVDSIEINITQIPSAKLTGVSEMFLLDSTTISINLSGTPPFIFKYGNENIVTSSPVIYRNFYPTAPKTYSLSISELSDANCAAVMTTENELTVKVLINQKYLAFWVLSFPNPVENELNLHVYNKPGVKLTTELYNIQGKLISKNEFPIVGYLEKYKMDLRDLTSGIYYLKINTGYKEEVRKVIKW